MSDLSRLTREALAALRRDWELWNPGVELVEPEHRTVGRPVSEFGEPGSRP